jgi:hypothetical protein
MPSSYSQRKDKKTDSAPFLLRISVKAIVQKHVLKDINLQVFVGQVIVYINKMVQGRNSFRKISLRKC